MRTRHRLITFAAGTVLAASAVAPATASAAVTHTVRRGETLTSVAATDGLSVGQLASANGLPATAELTVGAQLVIPPQSDPVLAATPAPATAQTAAPTAAAPLTGGGYVVRRGDTLSAIAARYGTTAAALAASNGLSVDGLLLAGRTLSVTGAGAATSSAETEPAASEAAPSPSPAAAPADEFVSPSEVGELAEQGGVSASLAEAIADQESGFNDDEVSSSGAVGVMQIEPATWAQLAGMDGLSGAGDPAVENIEGGVSLLGSLLADTRGDESEAIAAYYQGLQSVRSRGMFADTRHYVGDVLALQARFGG